MVVVMVMMTVRSSLFYGIHLHGAGLLGLQGLFPRPSFCR